MLMTMERGWGLARADLQTLLRHSEGRTIGKVEDHREERRSSVPEDTRRGVELGRHQQGLQAAPQPSASHRCSWTVCSP